ncbi:Retrovirus-related Pol polyprotein from transposon 17.6, partial [Frankliniella fusca]
MKETLNLSHLPPASREKLLNLFCEYKDIFTKTDESVGKFPDIYHHIPTEEGKIVRRKPYRIPYAERVAYQAEIDRLRRLGIIVRSTSEWCNPTIFLHKVLPCGRVKSKIILDSRYLNKITTDSVPFKTKRLDEALDFLSNKTHISRFDLASAFMSVPINPDHTHKLAFEGLRGEKWEYIRGCYGLKYLPMTFSWAMDTATSSIHDCYPYFDDLCLASTSFEQHLTSMRSLFAKLRQSNLKLRLDKTEVLPKTLTYLGFEITDGKIRPQKAKLEHIKKCPVPSGPPQAAKKALKSFLALTNWIHNSALLSRLIAKLLAYNVEFIYLAGPQMAADYLSRLQHPADSRQKSSAKTSIPHPLPRSPSVSDSNRTVMPPCDIPGPPPLIALINNHKTVTITDVRAAQGADAECTAIKENLHLYPEFVIRDNLLCIRNPKFTGFSHQIFVPVALRATIIFQCHNIGHFSLRKTYHTLRRQWVFPRMYTMAKQLIKTCKQCNGRNSPHQIENPPLLSAPLPTRPFERVEIDLIGEIFPHSSKGHTHILVIKDTFSKFIILTGLRRTDSETICRKLTKHLILPHGTPAIVKSDNAKNLTSCLMKDFLTALKIRKVELIPYSPQNNSVEASNKSIVNILSKLIGDNPRSWHSLLSATAASMNASLHNHTGFSPYEVITGRPYVFPWGELSTPQNVNTNNFVPTLKNNLRNIHESVSATLQETREATHSQKNKNRFSRKFEVHSKVWFKNPLRERQLGKFDKAWSGP